MKDMIALHNHSMRWWMATMESQADAATTIALRMPMLMKDSASGRGPSAESRRMIEEKMSAVSDGAVNAVLASGQLAARAMLGRLNAPKLASGMLAIAEAAMGPTHKTVKANARRLTGRGKVF